MDVLISNSVSRQIPHAQQARLLDMLSQQPGKQLAVTVTGVSVQSSRSSSSSSAPAIPSNYQIDFLIGKETVSLTTKAPLLLGEQLVLKVTENQTLLLLRNHSAANHTEKNHNERSATLSKPTSDKAYQPLLKIVNKQSTAGLADRQGNWQATVQASWLLTPEDQFSKARFGARLVKNKQVVDVITARSLLAGQQLTLKVEGSQNLRFVDPVQGLPKSPTMLLGSSLQLTDKGMAQTLAKMTVLEKKTAKELPVDNTRNSGGAAKITTNREMPLQAQVTATQIKAAPELPSGKAVGGQQYALQLKIGQLNVEVLSNRAILPGQQLALKVVANHRLQIVNQQATAQTEGLGVAAKTASPIVDIVSGSPQAIKHLQGRQGQVFQVLVISSNVISTSNQGLSDTALMNYAASLKTPEAELLEVRGTKALPKGTELSFRVLDNNRLKVESTQGSLVAGTKQPVILSVVKMPPQLAGQLVQRQGEQLQATVVEARVNVDNVSTKTVTYLVTLKIGDQQLEVASKQLLTAGQNLNLKVNNAVELQLSPRPTNSQSQAPASPQKFVDKPTAERQEVGKPAAAKVENVQNNASKQRMENVSKGEPSVVADQRLTKVSEATILKGPPQFILQLDKQAGQVLVATVVQTRVAGDGEVLKAVGQRAPTESVQNPGQPSNQNRSQGISQNTSQVVSLQVGKNTFDIVTTQALSRGDTLSLQVINAQQLLLLDKTNDLRKTVPGFSASLAKGLPSSPQSLTQAQLRVESESQEALQRLMVQGKHDLTAKVISSRLLQEAKNLQSSQDQVRRSEQQHDSQRQQQIAQQNQAKNLSQPSTQLPRQWYYEVELQIDKERILARSAQALAAGRSIDLQLIAQDKLQIMQTQQASAQPARDQQQKLLAGLAAKGANVAQSYLPDMTASLKQALQLVLEKQQSYAEFFKVFSQLQKGLGGTMSGPMATALSQLLAAIPTPGQLQTSPGLRDAVDNSGLFFETRQRLALVEKQSSGSVGEKAQGLGRSATSVAPGIVGATASNAETASRLGADKHDNVTGPGKRTSPSASGQSENRLTPTGVKVSVNREVSVDNKDRSLNQVTSPSQKSQAAALAMGVGKNTTQATTASSQSADLSSVAGRDLKGNMFNLMNEMHNTAQDSRFNLTDLLFSSQAPIAAISALSPIQREAYDAVASFFRFFVKNMAFSGKDAMSGKSDKVVKQDEERQQTVFRQLVSAISRTQLHQLNTVASQQSAAGDATLLNSWTFELPVMNGAQLDIIEFRIDHEEEAIADDAECEEEEQVRAWKVMLSFEIQPMGMMYVQIKLVLDSLSATFWSQRPQVLEVIEQEVGELKSNLVDFGVNVKEVNYIEGKPPSTAVRMDQYLVDIET